MTRTTIAFDDDVLGRAKAAAEADGMSLSDWVNDVIDQRLFRERLKRHGEWQLSRPDLFGPEATADQVAMARRMGGGR